MLFVLNNVFDVFWNNIFLCLYILIVFLFIVDMVIEEVIK